MNFSIGDTVGGYEIVGVLGSGGMGEVYRVRNVISDRVDAMKVLLASLQRDQDFASRFLREIKVQARLVHPNIAQLYTAFEHQGNLMMILELIDGMSLLEMLQGGRIPLLSAVDYAAQALGALSYAHTQGVIHRDIKPGNIMVTRADAVKLMDFGIAKGATDHSLTVTGNLIGSLYYMSPEQVRAEAIDSRSDLYSLGVVLYQMATGRKPFEGDSEYKIMRAQVEQAPPPPRDIDTTVPEGLNRIILRALAKDRAERFQTGDEFRDALQRVAVLLREEIGAVRNPTPSQWPVVPKPADAEAPTAPGAGVTPRDARIQQRSAPPGRPRRETLPPPASTSGTQPPAEQRRTPARRAASAAAGQDHEQRERRGRSRTPLWIGAGIAAAILVVVATQMHDWMAGGRPQQPVPETPAGIELQTPPDPPQAPPSAQPQTPTEAARQSAVDSTSAAPKAAQPLSISGGTASPPGRETLPRETSKPATPSESASAEPASREPIHRVPAPVQSPASSESPSESNQRSEPAARPPAAANTQQAVQSSATAGTVSAPPGPAAAGSTPNAANPPAPQSSAANPGPPPVSPEAAPQPAADRVYNPNEVDTPPRLLRQFRPRYTEAAHKAGVQGTVRLAAEIWPDGRAHNIRVVQSVGHADLDRNAMAALSLWEFAPGRKDGAAVKVRAVVDQSYRLQGGGRLKSAPALSKDP